MLLFLFVPKGKGNLRKNGRTNERERIPARITRPKEKENRGKVKEKGSREAGILAVETDTLLPCEL